MKLWTLGPNKNIHAVKIRIRRTRKYSAKMVFAASERRARQLVAIHDKSSRDANGESVWLNRDLTTCEGIRVKRKYKFSNDDKKSLMENFFTKDHFAKRDQNSDS